MAVEQTLALTKNIILCTSRNPPTSTHFQNPICHLRLFSSIANPSKSKRFNVQVKCSVDFSNNKNQEILAGRPLPRPAEIPWKKEICNTVQLIGIVATPVKIKQISSGKFVASSRLTFKKSPTETIWVNLTFWEELAHVAFQHLEKGNQIYVSGRLVSESYESSEGQMQTFFKVIVQQLNFITPMGSYGGDSSLAAQGRKNSNYSVNNAGSTEELWQAFFANPADWWDNRKDKRHPKYPDFKHKDTGESLWIESWANPPWVKSQLAILDSRRESFQDQNNGMLVNFVNGDDYSSF